MIVYTNGSFDGDDDIFYIHSFDHGSNWNGPWTYGQTLYTEQSALIHAGPNGKNFHVTFTKGDYSVQYMRRSQKQDQADPAFYLRVNPI